MKRIIKRRTISLLVGCILGIVVLLVRLGQLQLIETESFSDRQINLYEQSVAQRTQALTIHEGRGTFVDRNGEPITHRQIPALLLFPFLESIKWDQEAVAQIVDVPVKELEEAIQQAKEPFAFGEPDPMELTEEQVRQINELKIPGVFATLTDFPREKSLAAHTIGITGENPTVLQERYPDRDFPLNQEIGISGLEESFDEFLVQEGATKLLYHVDGIGGPLFGIDVKYTDPGNPFYPLKMKTTLDLTIQEKMEELVDAYDIQKGGLVLLDVQSGNILSMVSRPSISYEDPFKEDSARNRMTQQQVIGSVFKTVVAAATIEKGIDVKTRTFDCSQSIFGEENRYDYGMRNFEESFAISCNNTFAQLTNELQKLDETTLETYAKKVGLLGPVGWEGDVYHVENFRPLHKEDAGRVFLDEPTTDKNYLSQTGIGQYEVRATPLAVANMMATIARGGEQIPPRIVSEMDYQDGSKLYEFDQQSVDSSEELSPYGAMKVQSLLREVVTNEEGTGRWFQELPYEVAGKSGTGDVSTATTKEEDTKYNKWFAGYFPFEQPKYALAVVNLGVPSSEGGINGLFQDVVKALYEFDQQQ
ncbi:peptidoglycan D,D-transpeptidase FtsI family protein [Bacillus fonticola]|uniref:peptidoglycan D,D-transpeptidase FtsI family protein n=1 Tax=Bacillus fonticola TaxID=2728853 RepID=UPI001475D3E5|nr:penicillin-binding transpeptidase domain-containing protein [Bacillus fonticola]